MDKQTQIYQAGDTKIIEIHNRIHYFNENHPKHFFLPEFVKIYNDIGKVIGSAHCEADQIGINAILSFDYYSPERLVIENDDGFKYYAHPIFQPITNKILCVLLNTSKPEDYKIKYLKV